MDESRSPKLPNLSVEDDDLEATEMKSLGIDPAESKAMVAGFAAYPYLVLIAGTALRQVFPLDRREHVIGRASDSSIHVPEASISRAHARVVSDGADYTIEDLDSANGTFLNGKQIKGTYSLTPGDRIRLGPYLILRFEWPSDANDDSMPTSTSFRKLTETWSPTSWKQKPAVQVPKYDEVELAKSFAELEKLPGLVTSWEIEHLKSLIADAQNGERFLLQGGDCAEMFADCESTTITNKVKILLQVSLILTHAARKPVIRVGRFAGQYAKPRSSPTEIRDGVELPSYVGDLVNRPEFSAAARRADPQLLVRGYHHASLTLNFIRALSAGGLPDLGRPDAFEFPDFEKRELPADVRDEYVRMTRQLREGLHFLRAMGDGSLDNARVQFFTSHEGLNLVYEQAHTRQVPRRDGWYCLTMHLPWIGERTRALDGAHIEFFRGIANPIGVKIGPKAVPREVVDLLRTINPNNEAGKMVLIIRMGAGNVPLKLPPIIEAVTRARCKVLWVTDPMHGNGMVTKTGIKTRDFTKILQEVEETFDTHDSCGSRLGGVHFELTGDDVTECVGGGLTERDLDTRYLTTCDPRLNARQAIEMAFCIARRIVTSSVRMPSAPPPEL